jgi:hypothetical protein
VTDRLFVMRRALRVHDTLREDSSLRWQQQRGGWLRVDRTTGRVSGITLSGFDVVQLSRYQPVLKKPLSDDGVPDDAAPD